MKTRYKVATGVVAAFALAQLIRPARGVPGADGKAIAAHFGKSSGLAAVLDRSCAECHSNASVWPWYTEVAPLSWIAVSGVRKARQAVNFSEWDRYSPDEQHQLLQASCAAASTGKMPGSFYTAIEPKARLSGQDISIICQAADRPAQTRVEEQR